MGLEKQNCFLKLSVDYQEDHKSSSHCLPYGRFEPSCSVIIVIENAIRIHANA